MSDLSRSDSELIALALTSAIAGQERAEAAAESSYYTVLIPYVATETGRPTQWHPYSATGPFSVLSRGAFKTELEATKWADERLEGHPYSIKRIDV